MHVPNPAIEFTDMIVDNTCMQLVSNPNQFDVMVLPNLYGSVVANVCCGIVGGPGIAAGSNYGDQTAVFEMGTRNTGASIVGKNVANPVSFLMAGCKLLEYYQLQEHADLIRGACDHALNTAKVHTPDLKGQAHTNSFKLEITRNNCFDRSCEFVNCLYFWRYSVHQ